jgi:hypothetical protein
MTKANPSSISLSFLVPASEEFFYFKLCFSSEHKAWTTYNVLQTVDEQFGCQNKTLYMLEG